MTVTELGDLVGVERADVYKAGALAGSLTRDGDAVEFRYDSDYAADALSPAVAVSLPKSGDLVRATAGAVPPFFAGLLPEGARLLALTAAARTSLDDQLTLLLAVGADAIGDVQIVPTGQSPADPKPLVDLTAASTLNFAELFAQATSSDPAAPDRVALPGVQIKVSAAMVSTPVGTAAGPAILKLNPEQYPQLVENENFFLDMARACGLPSPPHQLVQDSTGRWALFVERFDRVVAPGQRAQRLPQEDACQVLGRYPAAKYRLTLQEVALGLAAAVEAAGGSRPLALRRVLEVAAFSYLIGNGDLHGKNLSIRAAPSGIWEVTPAYDLLSTQPYLNWRDPMSLPLYGRASRLTRRWWSDAASRLGLPQRAMSRSLDRIVESSGEWQNRVREIGLDDVATARLAKLIVSRRLELSA